MSDPDRLPEIKALLRRHAVSSGLTRECLAAGTTADWLVGKVEQLRDLLARLEWAGSVYAKIAGGPVPICPACRTWRAVAAHAPGCELAAVLHPGTQRDPPHPEG